MSSTPLITSFLIDQWAIGEKQVSLFRCENEADLEFSVEEGGHQISKGKKIDAHLYENIRRTSAIVNLFHEVIKVNLLSSIESSSFLPVLETHAWANKEGEFVPLGHLRVALFGRGDPKTETLREARWGVFDDSDSSCRIFEIQKVDGAIKECLLNTLCYRLNATSYARRLRIEATLDSNNKVESLALVILNRISLFCKNVFLDEKRWAVTLVSAQPGTVSSNWRGGHAMIACEGVKDGYQFFKYLHISTNNPDQNCLQAKIQAQIKIKKEFIPNTLNGPTWVRPRTVIESMLYPIQEPDRHRKIVPFALGIKFYKPLSLLSLFCVSASLSIASYYCYRKIFVFCSWYNPRPSFSFIFRYTIRATKVVPSLMIASLSGASTYTSNKLGQRYDCLHWALEQLSEAGIKVELPYLSVHTPNAAVQFLNEHPEIITFTD